MFFFYLKYFSKSTTTRLRILPGFRRCWSCTQDVRVGSALTLPCLSSCMGECDVCANVLEIIKYNAIDEGTECVTDCY